MSDMLIKSEIADLLGVSPAAVTNWAARGKLPPPDGMKEWHTGIRGSTKRKSRAWDFDTIAEWWEDNPTLGKSRGRKKQTRYSGLMTFVSDNDHTRKTCMSFSIV